MKLTSNPELPWPEIRREQREIGIDEAVSHVSSCYKSDDMLKLIVQTGSTLYRLPAGGVAIETDDPRLKHLTTAQANGLARKVSPKPSADAIQSVNKLLDGVSIQYLADDAGVADAVQELLEDAKSSGCVALDTETAVKAQHLSPIPVAITKAGKLYKKQPKDGAAGYALDPNKAYIRLLQAYAGGRCAYIFDMDRISWGLVEPIIHVSPAICFHNAVFDTKMLIAGPGIEPTCRIYDTMTAERLIDGSDPRSLRDNCRDHLGVTLPKELATSGWHQKSLTRDQLRYAAADVVAAFRLWKMYRSRFDEIDEKAQRLADAMVVPIARMELAGLPVDTNIHQQMIHKWEDQLTEAQAALEAASHGKLAGKPTPRQIISYLEYRLTETEQRHWPKTEKVGILSTSKQDLINHGADIPGISELLELRAWEKQLSTYGEKLLNKVEDGRLHSHFIICGARTGRLSSRDANLQNMPKRGAFTRDFRNIFKAPSGFVLLAADYSQIELRVAAELSGDQRMRNAFEQGVDLHAQTADLMGAGDGKDGRSKAKACSFGLLYGSGVEGFCKYAKAAFGLDMSASDAQELMNRFFRAYPDLKRWQVRHVVETRSSGYVSTKGGRRWKFSWRAKSADDPGIDDVEDYFRADYLSGYHRNFALNHPVQGSAAEVMALALIFADKALRDTPARIGAVVHDELVVECQDDPETIAKVRGILDHEMTRSWRHFFPNAPYKGLVDIEQGNSWGELA